MSIALSAVACVILTGGKEDATFWRMLFASVALLMPFLVSV